MCNYSHYDILKFKKWPEDCWKTCGFEYLATGDSFELNDWSHIAVLDQFKANLQALPNDKQLACAIYSVRTACVVENTSYVYVLLGVMSLFFLCSCCGCLCCLPASLLVSGRYLKELRNYNKATTALGESPSPPAGHVQMTTP
ncbi:transmembrane protein [Cystoisospora suis]|uniref:Transmembrane protein n=1 Tax=Cystoisospora suis TaxID=483139 RepID=A0A2C6L246_9APIC|nr:transmembrane protein [Cystoisospora suis]